MASSASQNASAAFCLFGVGIRFHRRAGVNVGRVVSAISGYSIRMPVKLLRPALGGVFLLMLAAGVATPQTGVHPLSGRRYAQTMGVEGADWLDRAERDLEEDPDRAVDVLKLPKGAIIADIGAGSGYMTE